MFRLEGMTNSRKSEIGGRIENFIDENSEDLSMKVIELLEDLAEELDQMADQMENEIEDLKDQITEMAERE